LGAAIGAAAVALGPQSAMPLGSSARAAAADTYHQLILFCDVFEKVGANYVEEPDEAKLVEGAINGMLSSLDPHSSYMGAENFRDMQEDTKGECDGLGIEVIEEDGLIKVVTPIDDTPAAKAGILSGDIITEIDGEAMQELTLDQVADKMRGAVGTPVTLKISRGPNKDVKEIKIVRDVIKIQSVRSHVEGDDLGYIRIMQFNEQTYDGLKSAMEKFQNGAPGDGLKGYILDLLNNPGGLVDQSIEVANAFLERGEIVSPSCSPSQTVPSARRRPIASACSRRCIISIRSLITQAS
jgi:carboxyl-terminal processing protease